MCSDTPYPRNLRSFLYFWLYFCSSLWPFTLCDRLCGYLLIHRLQYRHHLCMQDFVTCAQLIKLLSACSLPELLPCLIDALCLGLRLLIQLLERSRLRVALREWHAPRRHRTSWSCGHAWCTWCSRHSSTLSGCCHSLYVLLRSGYTNTTAWRQY